MTSLIADPTLGDACPRCAPGDVPAASPVNVTVAGGALLAGYACGTCGTAWRTWWDLASVWPQRREVIASVTELLDELIAAMANLLDGEVTEGRESELTETEGGDL
jgi:hypothetical protein